jgi:hypothetical protein
MLSSAIPRSLQLTSIEQGRSPESPEKVFDLMDSVKVAT